MTDPKGFDAARVIGLFGGGMRAEYDKDRLATFFAEPTYWSELANPQPVFLTGPRGTGKTMVLRALSQTGERERWGTDVSKWNHVGLYWRVETGVSHAFKGGALEEDQWAKVFAHYLNLVLLARAAKFLEESSPYLSGLNAICLDRVANSLGRDFIENVQELTEVVSSEVARLEFFINNADGRQLPNCSIAGLPLHYLVDELQIIPELTAKYFYVLIDEYESLLPYQQRIVNGIIRHTGDSYVTYKVGRRAHTRWDRRTPDLEQTLDSPADFREIDISIALAGGEFSAFAAEVCNRRLALLTGAAVDVETLFPSISAEEEAAQLGLAVRLDKAFARMAQAGVAPTVIAAFRQLPKLDAFFLFYWSGEDPAVAVRNLTSYLREPDLWARRKNNEAFSMMFTIRDKNVGIRKFYAGWRTFSLLADGNIRFFMQLVQEAIIRQLREGRSPQESVPAHVQTDAAVAVGQEALRRIPSAGGEANALARLILGLGRVFQIMARQPFGHTPEVTQFVWKRSGSSSEASRLEEILQLGVATLALQRMEVDKRALVSGEVASLDQYQMHPIFSPYFQFSHRSKRRMTIDSATLIGLIDTPEETVLKVLREQRRTVTLPEIANAGTLFEELP